MSKKKPPFWTNIYPIGTPEGDEECRLFIALARNPKYEWRSTAALVKESGLSKKRVEEILSKYHKKHMVFQSPKNADHWGYWERVPEMLPDKEESLAKKDQNIRIDKAMKEVVQLSLFDVGRDKKTPQSSETIEFYYLKPTYGLSLPSLQLSLFNKVTQLKRMFDLKTADELLGK
jgi:hypothetical protein